VRQTTGCCALHILPLRSATVNRRSRGKPHACEEAGVTCCGRRGNPNSIHVRRHALYNDVRDPRTATCGRNVRNARSLLTKFEGWVNKAQAYLTRVNPGARLASTGRGTARANGRRIAAGSVFEHKRVLTDDGNFVVLHRNPIAPQRNLTGTRRAA